MNIITLHNYEAFLLDYAEGNLSESGEKILKDFLAAHPELEADLDEDFSTPRLQAPVLPFSLKNNLLKEDIDETFGITRNEYLCIAEAEGDSTASEKRELNHELQQTPKLQKMLDLLKKVKLQPNLSVYFPKKKNVRRREMTFYLKTASGIAAALLLFALILPYGMQNSAPENLPARSASYAESKKRAKNVERIVLAKISEEKKVPKSSAKKKNTNRNYTKKYMASRAASPKKMTTQPAATNQQASEEKKFHVNNQLVKQPIGESLAFMSRSPADANETHPVSSVVPERKSAALILNNREEEIFRQAQSLSAGLMHAEDPGFRDQMWKVAEKSVHVIRVLTSGNVSLKNNYSPSGKVQRVELMTPRMRVRRNFSAQTAGYRH